MITEPEIVNNACAFVAVYPQCFGNAQSGTGIAKQRPTRQQQVGRGLETLSTMSGSREEERRKLADIINHWNANRLDLFEISRPTEVGDQPGPGGEAADPWALLPVTS
ncbi:hypothetical protein Q8A73_018212 [Channa argus]|nr:hypothetical protein Q8A73_018212 [Channa argus]